MSSHDLNLLKIMHGIIEKSTTDLRDDYIDNMLSIRDELDIEDHEWYHRLTNYLADLDSINNYYPKTDIENKAKKDQIDITTKELSKMVIDKINSLDLGL